MFDLVLRLPARVPFEVAYVIAEESSSAEAVFKIGIVFFV
jgi:hypothetical protein